MISSVSMNWGRIVFDNVFALMGLARNKEYTQAVKVVNVNEVIYA